MRATWICYSFASFLILNCHTTTAKLPTFDYQITNLSTSWSISNQYLHYVHYYDGSRVRVILLRGTDGPSFACGFYCNGNCTSYLFAVFFFVNDYEDGSTQHAGYPQVVWSANRDHPVSGGVLNLTATGGLVLQDADGSTVWSTNTTGKSVAAINLTDDGNLVLFDINNSMVWQSFDYPTDCLLPGQALYQGKRLIPSVSSTNWTAQKDLFSLHVTYKGFFGYVGSNPPQAYKGFSFYKNYTDTGRIHLRYINGSLSYYIHSVEPNEPDEVFDIPPAISAQYIKLMPNGHLSLFEWKAPDWIVVADLFNDNLGECNYPMACGRYGVCSSNQQCSCPKSSYPGIEYFKATNNQQPNMGCSIITPLTCNASVDQVLIRLENVTYYTILAHMKSVDMEACKQACVHNCSCKGALFRPDHNSSTGDCFLPSEVFTMIGIDPENPFQPNNSAFVKVQNVRSPPPRPSGPSAASSSKSRSNLRVVLASVIGSAMFLLGAIGFLFRIIRKRREAAQMEEDYIGEIPGMPTRFSYEELNTTTESFNKKLGQGGFGAVYKGTLEDGSDIAVKCLEGLGKVKMSFLAEVESIGSIHHVNLVRLRGFCAWRSQWFLVYEFMSNGSLDRWIYHGDREHALGWECRNKIILDVAKGLAYLHEECRQKIIHLDIKPQNILLDSDFNAKVSDFGLAKLIEKNQTQVMTTMRGTPGYLAPEWLSSVITEKVDVYSFGIVLLETMCGRKKFDNSQPEESWHLLNVLQKCWEEGMLVDMIDKYSEDMQAHAPEGVEMIKVASWCLQFDFKKRPLMSTVVKVLEGLMKVEASLDYNFTDPRMQNTTVDQEKDMTQLLASVISGPR